MERVTDNPMEPSRLVKIGPHELTAEEIFSHASQKCKTCHGKGTVRRVGHPHAQVCNCVVKALVKKYGDKQQKPVRVGGRYVRRR